MIKDFFVRMTRYLNKMFPLGRHCALSMLIYFSVACFGGRLSSTTIAVASWHNAVGISSVFGLFLMLRLMDELKDYDLDLKLFPDRPICTGMVKAEDIRIGLGIVTALLLAINTFAGVAIWSAALLVAFAYLMFWHFFARDMLRASLPLTLLTHQPIIPLLLLHCLAIVADEQHRRWDGWDWSLVTPFVVLLWMPFLGWEISRKIRSPRDETQYVTYSRLFGPQKAALLALAVEAVSLICAMYLCSRLSLPVLYWMMMAVVFLVYGIASLTFVFDVQRTAKHLKGFAEFYLVGVFVVQVLTFGFL